MVFVRGSRQVDIHSTLAEARDVNVFQPSTSSFESLRTGKEFAQVTKKGKKFVSKGFILFALQKAKEHPHIKIGIVASRKVGNAVKRNKAKRVFRALSREVIVKTSKTNMDYVIISRAGFAELDHAQLTKLFKQSMKYCNASR